MEQITERDAQLLEFIPEEILFEILTRLPVRSLLKFRCVCKSWNSLISSPNFINAHLASHAMDSDYILVKSRGTKSLYSAKDFTKYMDLDLRSSDMNLHYSNAFLVYGSCNGLLCIFVTGSLLFIWNPSIRKIKRVPQGLYQDADFNFKRIGFGFNHQKNDYQVVEIIGDKEHMYKAEVYSFRLDSWRELRAVPPVSFPLSYLDHYSIDANGVVYWIFRRYDHSRRFILSFDMNNEVFQKIEFPDIPLHRGFRSTISFQEFEKSLSLINLLTHDYREDDDNGVTGDSHCDIWVMGLNNNTWKKTSTILLPQVIDHPSRYIRAGRPLSLTKDGLYIAMVYLDEYSSKSRAIVDDHISREANKEITVVEVCRPSTPVEVLTYKESLELLN